MRLSCSAFAALFLLSSATTAAANWADEKEWPEYEASKEICRRLRHVMPPEKDKPPPEQVAALKGCDAEELYYGIGRRADPDAARACALAGLELGPFQGEDLLMVIYANGVGAERDFDVATALACRIGGAPAEAHGRVMHLARLKETNWRGTDFSWCTNITSGHSMGYCAGHDARIEGAKRDAVMAQLSTKWSGGKASASFTKLRQAAEDFFRIRASAEIDQSGTARAAMTIEEEEALRTLFVQDLQAFASGAPPCKGAQANRGADPLLNAVYKQIQRRPQDSFDMGTVTQAGIKETQRAWLPYRDAWVAFVAATSPEIPKDAVVNWLTLRRVKQLEEFAN